MRNPRRIIGALLVGASVLIGALPAVAQDEVEGIYFGAGTDATEGGSHEVFVTTVAGLECRMTTFEGGGFLAPIHPELGFEIPGSGARFPGWLTVPFSGSPSPPTIAFWLGGTSREITFVDPVSSVSFFYVSSVSVGISAFDADNNLIASVSAPPNLWAPLGVDVGENIITRIIVTGDSNLTGIDNFESCGVPNVPPVALCQDVVVELGDSGEGTLASWEVNGGSFDPDGDPISVSLDRTSFDCTDLGTQVVTLTVTDDSGAESTCEAIVTVVDGGDPPLGCPDDILVFAEEAGGLPATDPAIGAFLSGATVYRNIVDFEGLSLPSGTPITNEVEGMTMVNGGVAVDPIDVLGVPTQLDTNGENMLFNLDPLEPLVIVFDSPVTGLQMEGAAFAGTITLEAFDAGDVPLATDSFDYGDPTSTTVPDGDIELFMASSARNISKIVITYTPAPVVIPAIGPRSFVVDDFAFVWRQLVDFEGLPNFTIPAPDQFEGVTVGNGIVVSDPVLILGIPTDLDPNGENTLAVFPDAATPITFTFDEPASNISLELSAFAGTFTVNSFDADGSLIDSEAFVIPDVIGLPIPLSVSGASSIEVSHAPTSQPLAGYVMDDLAFSFGVVECDPATSITNDAPATFPVGVTTVTFTATDTAGNSSSCSADVTVVSVRAVPDALFPPDHKMHEIQFEFTPADGLVIELVEISSDESDNGFGLGDGNTDNDMQGDPDGVVFLRSERQGRGDGRVYTIVHRVTDASGNSVLVQSTVEVPHDASGHSCGNLDCDLNNS